MFRKAKSDTAKTDPNGTEAPDAAKPSGTKVARRRNQAS